MTTLMHRITPSADLTSPAAAHAGRRFARWPMIVVGLLFLNITITGALVAYANTDSSYAVEPEFYQKALAWDQTQAQMGQNARLSWVAAGDVSPRQDAAGLRSLHLLLRDRDARPITGATVRIEAFHQARSGQRLRTELKDAGDGSYLASLPLSRPGLWEVRLIARHAAGTFTRKLTIEVREATGTDDGVSD